MQGRLSLRERLVIVMVIALVPVIAVFAWIALRDSRAAANLAQSQLTFAASLLAATQGRDADAAEQLLNAIATLPDARTGGPESCNATFARLRDRHPMYTNIGLISPEGQVLCHALGGTITAPVAQRDDFREALATKKFVMGSPFAGPVSGRRALPFALPILEEGQVRAVAFATLDLERAAAQLGLVPLPQGAQVLVADRRGAVLMAFPERPVRPGLPAASIADEPDYQRAAQELVVVNGESRAASGESLLVAYATSRAIGPQGFVVRVAVDKAVVAMGDAAHRREGWLMMAVMLLAAAAATWFLGGRMIVKPAKQILGAVRRIEQGRLEARVPLYGNTHRGEFARIAGAFNLMAESLQLRQIDIDSELRRSRGAYEMLDQVLNSMQEGLVAVTAEGRFLMFNDAASRLLPLSAPPALPQLWAEHFGFYMPDRVTHYRPDDLPLVRSALGESGREELVFVRNALVPEGRYLQCSWQPIHAGRDDEGGAARGGLVVFTDVTAMQQLQAEQAAQFRELQATQQKWVEAQRIGRVGNWELDLVTGRLGWSDEVYALFGVSREAFDGTVASHASLVHPDDRSLLKPARDRALLDGDVSSVEYRVVRADGTVAWMREIGQARRGEDGAPEWLGGVVQNITRSKQDALENARLLDEVRDLNATLEARIAERTAELARQEQRFRTLAEQAPEVVWNVDHAGGVTYLNRAWYELVGGEPADWLGQGWMQRVHPDDRAEVEANWLRSRKSLQGYMGTRRLLARDGTWHTMSYKASPVLGDDGRVAFWVGIDADITELKAIEAALRGSNQELEAFSHSVSHDLRAPLGAIAGFSRALEGRLAGVHDERAAHFLARIQAGVVKMESLIEAMLSLSRVVRAPLAWGSVDISAIARDTVEGLHMQNPERKVVVNIAEGLEAHGDARLLRVVLENLLGNAWKFSTHAPDAVIEVGRLANGGPFFVSDNGVGFDMTYAAKLFTAFHRLHTDAEFPGTGIGLATVRRIISRHQGRVWAQSAPGHGTTFYFSLGDAPPPAWLTVPGAESS